MNSIKPPVSPSYHSPASIQPLAPASAPGHIGNTAFPKLLAPKSIDNAAMSALARIASNEGNNERGFIASTALAAFSQETLSLSLPLGKDSQQAQYGIKVWNQKGKLLGRLAADVKQAGQNSYELLAAHFTRAGSTTSTTSIGFKRDVHGVLQTDPGPASPLPQASNRKRGVRPAAPEERAKAQILWDEANRQYQNCSFSEADT